MLDRRTLLHAACCALAAPSWSVRAAAGDEAAAVAALRAGGTVAAFRHALAPGTLDPPGFRLGNCSTQRNLDEAGRLQAHRLGAWFTARGLVPRTVRSSPWCRCLETARLAFGERVEAWDALGSLREGDPAAQVTALRAALARLPPGGFEVWVSHQFTLSALAGTGTSPGEGLVLAGRPDGAAPSLLARLPPP